MSHHREWSPVWHPTSSRSSSLPWWRPLIPASREKLRVIEAIITNTTCERKKKMLPLGYPGFLDWVHIFTIQESRFAAICCNYDPIRFIQIVMQYNTTNSILNAIKFTSLMIENSPILIPFNQLQKWATYNTLPLTPFTMQGDLRPLQPDVKKKSKIDSNYDAISRASDTKYFLESIYQVIGHNMIPSNCDPITMRYDLRLQIFSASLKW